MMSGIFDIFKKKRREKTGADFTKERNAKKEQRKQKELKGSKGGGYSFNRGRFHMAPR